MKYYININQLGLADSNIDIIDAAILSYLYNLSASANTEVNKKRTKNESGVWTWVNYKELTKQMPLLRITSIAAISRRVNKIEDDGFIETLIVPQKNGAKKYFKITNKTSALFIGSTDIKPVVNEQLGHKARSHTTTTPLLTNNDPVVIKQPISILDNKYSNDNKGINFINDKKICKDQEDGGDFHQAIIEIISLLRPVFEMDFSGNKNPYENTTIRDLVKTAIKIKTLDGLKKMIADFTFHRKDQFIPKPSTIIDFLQYKFYGIDSYLNQRPEKYSTKNIPGEIPGEFNRTHKEFLDRVNAQEWKTSRKFYKDNKDKLNLETFYKNYCDKYDLDNLNDVE